MSKIYIEQVDGLAAWMANIDSKILLVKRGTWDPADPFPGGSGTNEGNYWIVDTPGTRDGVDFDVNDWIIAIIDTPSTTTFAGNWEKNDNTDKVTSVRGETGDVASVPRVIESSSAPTINDDELDNIEAGDIWIHTTGPTIYICKDASAGAAIWKNPLELKYEVAFVDITEMLQRFDVATTITAMKTHNVTQLDYDLNESGSYTNLILDIDGNVSGLPLNLSIDDTITWKIAYASGKNKASILIKGYEV